MAVRIPFNHAFWQEYLTGQEAKLPSLPDISNVSKRVVRILERKPGSVQLQSTNTYLMGTGQSRILIDTAQGLPVWIDRMTSYLHTYGLQISHVLLTHRHEDHTAGVPDLLACYPSLADRIYKNHPDAGQSPIIDGQIFSVDSMTVRAIFTPGHAVDHMCFLLEEDNALFMGDNVLGHGYSVMQDLGRYMDSLGYMTSLGCQLGYPAHGVVIHDLPGKLKEYIEHKEARVRLVFSTLVRQKARVRGRRRREGRNDSLWNCEGYLWKCARGDS